MVYRIPLICYLTYTKLKSGVIVDTMRGYKQLNVPGDRLDAAKRDGSVPIRRHLPIYWCDGEYSLTPIAM